MPQMGVSVAEGTIVEWRKRPGDWVEADETICEVTTDKVDVEIPSPGGRARSSGSSSRPARRSPVGTPLAEIDAGAAAGRGASAKSDAGRAAAPTPSARRRTMRPTAPAFYSPVVRRIAAEHGIDLERGRGHRRRRPGAQDATCSAHIEARPADEAAGSGRCTPSRPTGPEAASRATASSATGGGDGSPARREPMSPMRQAIAEHMVESRRTSAHCTTIVEVDFVARSRRAAPSCARRWRGAASRSPTSPSSPGRRSRRCAEHPVLNASVDGDEIVYHDDVNLGIAVALETG